jgi:hypothetical protein
VFSEIGLVDVRTDGNSQRPPPVTSCSSRSTAIDCRANGTRCGRLIFIFLAGMLQTARSNSDHSACRSSPGLTKTYGASRSAARVVGCPSKPSTARSSAPIALGSTMVARCCGVVRAPRRSSPSATAPWSNCLLHDVIRGTVQYRQEPHDESDKRPLSRTTDRSGLTLRRLRS